MPETNPNENICPECNLGHLKIKTGKYGDFFGCSTYPECKYTANLINPLINVARGECNTKMPWVDASSISSAEF